jgi:hypothetical protein
LDKQKRSSVQAGLRKLGAITSFFKTNQTMETFRMNWKVFSVCRNSQPGEARPGLSGALFLFWIGPALAKKKKAGTEDG